MAVDFCPTVHGMAEFYGMMAGSQGVEYLIEKTSPMAFAFKELRKELGNDHPVIIRFDELRSAAAEELTAGSRSE